MGSQPVTSVTLTEEASSKRQRPKQQPAGALVHSVDKLYMFVYCSDLTYSDFLGVVLNSFPPGRGGFTSKFSMKPSGLGFASEEEGLLRAVWCGVPLQVPRTEASLILICRVFFFFKTFECLIIL